MSSPLAVVEENTKRRQSAGRPRSEDSRLAILDAARRLLTHTPVAKISIEAIAKKAGVGKTTIYRWWPDRTAVLMEAIFSQPGYNNILPSTNSAAEGIYIQLEKLVRLLNGKNGRIVAEIFGEAQASQHGMHNFVDTFLKDRYNALASAIGKGRESGELGPETDTNVVVDMILGAVFFRLLTDQVLDESFPKRLCDQLFREFAVNG